KPDSLPSSSDAASISHRSRITAFPEYARNLPFSAQADLGIFSSVPIQVKQAFWQMTQGGLKTLDR
ncbi:hypothetical protein CO666_32920, partial [Rhizobium chutanense]